MPSKWPVCADRSNTTNAVHHSALGVLSSSESDSAIRSSGPTGDVDDVNHDSWSLLFTYCFPGYPSCLK